METQEKYIISVQGEKEAKAAKTRMKTLILIERLPKQSTPQSKEQKEK